MNPALRTALGIIAIILAVVPSFIFLSARQLSPALFWIAGICCLFAGIGLAYAFPPRIASLKILYGILAGGMLFICSCAVAFFVGCSRIFH